MPTQAGEVAFIELSHERIGELARLVPGEVVVYLVDDGLHRLYASDGIPALTGHTPEEYKAALNEDAFDAVAESDRPRIQEEIARGLREGHDFDITYRVVNVDRGFIWVHGRGKVIGTMEGKPVVLATLVNASLETAPQDAMRENSDRPIYVIDRATFEILYMNSSCEALFGKKPFLDQRCHDFKYSSSVPCPWCPIPTLRGKAAHLGDRRSDVLGRWYQYDYRRLDWFGRDAVAVYAFDVTERRNEQAQLRDTLEREERLVSYIKTLNSPGSLQDRINEALRDIGMHLEADRAYLFEVQDGRNPCITYEWCRDGVAPAIESFRDGDNGLTQFWFGELESGRNVVVPDIEGIRDLRPQEYAIMREWDVQSYAESPLLVDGELLGFIGVDNPLSERVESSADLLLSFSYYLSSAIVRARDEQSMRESKRRFELAIEGAELGVWEYDIKRHTIMSPSNSFAKFGVTGPIKNVPQSILPMFDEGEKKRIIDFYRRVDSGEPKITADFWMRWLPNAAPRCERVTYTVEKDDEGNPTTAYGIGMNFTAQKQEQESYESFLKQLSSAGPDTRSLYQFNLTLNTSELISRSPDYPQELATPDTVDEIVTEAATRLANDDERERFFSSMTRTRLIARFLAGESDISESYRCILQNGRTRWEVISIHMIKNPQSQDILAAVSVKDGDDEVVRELILEHVTESGYDYISVIYPDDATIRIYYHNASVPSALTDQQRATAIDYPTACVAAESRIVPTDLDSYREKTNLETIVRQLSENGAYSFEVDAKGANGETRRKLISFVYLAAMHERIMETQRDITESYLEQQHALQLANAETERVRDILDTISGGIGVLHMTDPDHLSIDYVNRQLYRILKFTPLENSLSQVDATANGMVAAFMTNAFIGIHPDDVERVRETFRSNFHSEHFVIEDYRTQCADGSYVWIREEVTLREVTPEHRVFYAIFQDVGEEVALREKLEQQLEEEKTLRIQADAANAAKSNFLSNVSHDMRTPLNAVLGYAEIARETQDQATVQGYLDKVERSGKVLQQLINDTLDLNKISTGVTVLHPEPIEAFDIWNDLDTAIRPAMEEKGITFTSNFDACPMMAINVDVVRLREIFLNLLNNAMKFTPRGGSVTLTVRRLSTDGSIVHDSVEISDTGCGMSAGFLPHVFEPFAQERNETTSGIEGSGLGLAIVKGLVDQMGGRIEAKSQLGSGSTFTVYLDFELADTAPQTAAPLTPSKHELAGTTVLLAEDNAMNTEIAKILLERMGMEVLCVHNGKECVEAFESSFPSEFDVVLMDIRMPVMDGIHATRTIRALDRRDAKTIPIIAMTANAYEDDVRECLDAGMNAHVAKPVDPAMLYRTIEEHLDRA